jgi:hypothetical protein
LFVSGSEIGWDLDRATGPTAADRAFLNEQLHADFGSDVNDDAQTFSFVPVSDGIFAGNMSGQFDDGTKGTYYVAFPDVLTPLGPGAKAALRYASGIGGAAAVQYDGSFGGGKVVYFGFPFETIDSPALRNDYLSDVLKFFGMLEPPRLASPSIQLDRTIVTLTWSAIPGKHYQLQAKAGFSDVLWQNVGTVITANELNVTTTDTVTGTQKFYRVVMLD